MFPDHEESTEINSVIDFKQHNTYVWTYIRKRSELINWCNRPNNLITTITCLGSSPPVFHVATGWFCATPGAEISGFPPTKQPLTCFFNPSDKMIISRKNCSRSYKNHSWPAKNEVRKTRKATPTHAHTHKLYKATHVMYLNETIFQSSSTSTENKTNVCTLCKNYSKRLHNSLSFGEGVMEGIFLNMGYWNL